MTVRNDSPAPPYVLRSLRPGDTGLITARHGILYAKEYNWNTDFEILVAGILTNILQTFDQDRERFWIAESQLTSEFLGCIALAKDPDNSKVAQLRLLLVEEEARGMGLGARLIDECVGFARDKEYGEVVLWTYSVLKGARRLYKRAGFRLVEAMAEQVEYGQGLRKEIWKLELADFGRGT